MTCRDDLDRLDDLARLSEILLAEIDGHPVDIGEAGGLAQHLAKAFPTISGTLAQISRRMGASWAGVQFDSESGSQIISASA